MGDSGEGRVHPRVPIELKVEYRKLNTFFYDYTHNISKGGTFIKTPRPLEVGTEFLFKLNVPHLTEPLALTGRVIWIVREEEAGADPAHPDPGMGIQFIFVSDEQRSEIEGRVEQLMREQLGDRAYEELLGRHVRERQSRS